MSVMIRFLLFILAGLLLAGLACDTPGPTPTAAPVATPTLAPTPTAKPAPTQTPTPEPAPLDALSIVRAAEENLKAASSFRVTALTQDGFEFAAIEADIVSPNRGRILVHRDGPLVRSSHEFLLIDGSHYYRPPGFQVWFDPAGRYYVQPEIQGFPYELAALHEEVRNLALRGSEVIEGVTAYRLTGTGTRKLEMGMGIRPGYGRPKMELWISQADLLPLRIEARYEEINKSFSAVYSAFGAEVDVSVPEEVWDIDYLARLWQGPLSGDVMSRLLRVFPVEGQRCVEADIGTDLYREVLSGDSDADIVLGMAFTHCRNEILSRTSDLFLYGIAETLYELDLTVLSIQPEQMVEEVVECLKESIGRESLFEIGSLYGVEEERAPTPEELAAAQKCNAGSEE